MDTLQDSGQSSTCWIIFKTGSKKDRHTFKMFLNLIKKLTQTHYVPKISLQPTIINCTTHKKCAKKRAEKKYIKLVFGAKTVT